MLPTEDRLPVEPSFAWQVAYTAYRVLSGLGLLVLGPWYLWRKGGALPDLRQRMGRLPDAVRRLARERPIWIHAVSVGEAKTARPLVEALRERLPSRPVVVSTVTPTGQAVAAALPGVAATFYLPFDTAACVRRSVRALAPSVLVIVETELWPVLLRESGRLGVPVVVVNGRISDRAFPRYRRLRWFFGPLLAGMARIDVRSEQDARRYAACGAPAAALHVAGNLKYDALPAPVDGEARRRLREAWHLAEDDVVCVAGSTFPGEEELVREAWQAACPEGRLILAPRHVHRAAEVRSGAGGGAALWSQLPRMRAEERPPVMVLDEMGRLAETYAVADVAVVGKSFTGSGGQNPLEPAAQGVPVVFGPEMSNFPEDAPYLVERGGAVQATADTLAETLASLAGDAARRRRIGAAARGAVEKKGGVAAEVAEQILQILADRDD